MPLMNDKAVKALSLKIDPIKDFEANPVGTLSTK